MLKKTHLFLEDFYAVQSQKHKYHVDIWIFKIEGIVDKKPFYDSQVGNAITEDLDKAKPIITGFIKWDGCSNWSFKTEECMMHFCTKEELIQLGVILGKCHDIAKEELDGF